MALSAPRNAPRSFEHDLDLDAVADNRLVFDYDPDSDTLIVHLHGRGRPAVSINAGDNAYVRLDRVADEIVGLHLENVLRTVVPEYPELLDHAEVYGITPAVEDAPSATHAPARRRAALAALAGLFGSDVAVGSR